jgi:uncharacterized protein
MSFRTADAEKKMAALFEGLSRRQQMTLLGRLEMTGAAVYRAFAKDEKNAKAREALLQAAGNEEKNGNLLSLMSTPKEQCEKCGKSMAVVSDGVSCSFQCTFCDDCATALKSTCPNCGGMLESRQRLV